MENLETFKQFTELLRTGLPTEVIDIIHDHTSTPRVTVDKAPGKESCKNNDIEKSSGKAENLSSPLLRELPHSLKAAVNYDFLIYSVPGDGACFYNSAAAHIYQDENQASNLRRLAHYFIVNNWWFFKDFYSFPFVEQVGVGEQKKSVFKETESDLTSFLLSEESLKCYSSGVDTNVISNMFNIRIWIFTYNLDNLEPRWTLIEPEPLLASYSEYQDESIGDMWLFHADNSHYDLLVTRDSSLAKWGNVPTRLAKLLNLRDYSITEELLAEDFEDEEIDEIIELVEQGLVPNNITKETTEMNFSPMLFKPCPRGPGRPKGGRVGAPHTKGKLFTNIHILLIFTTSTTNTSLFMPAVFYRTQEKIS